VEFVDGTLHVRDSSMTLLSGPDAPRAWSRLAAEARARGSSTLSFECLGPDSFIANLLQAKLTARGGRPVFGAVRDERDATQPWFLTGADEDE
jgi:hypothetical protein